MDRYRIAPNGNTISQTRPTTITAPSYISLPPKPHLPPRPRRSGDPDISIFDAQRYFNDAGNDSTQRPWLTPDKCDHPPNPRDSPVSSIDGYGRNLNRNSSSFHATPTASSEASWNSQTGLLANLPGSLTINVRATEHGRKRPTTSSSRRLFSSCPCAGKKSVDVEERFTEPKTPVRQKQPIKTVESPKLHTQRIQIQNVQPVPNIKSIQNIQPIIERDPEEEEVTKLKIVAGGWTKDEEVLRNSDRFPQDLSHRILNSNSRRPFTENLNFSFPVLPPITISEEPPRDSLEVFRPSELARKSAELQRHALERRSFTSREEDAGSDASSDLFELESFSTQMSTYRRQDSFDELTDRFDVRKSLIPYRRSIGEGTPSIAPSECYAPSEVSVEWSVTTAEGFDRGSVANFPSSASEYDEMRFTGDENDRLAAAAVTGGGGGGRKKGSGLLSCVCEKAVSVGPSPVRFVAEEREEVVARLGGGKVTVAAQSDRVGRLAHKR